MLALAWAMSGPCVFINPRCLAVGIVAWLEVISLKFLFEEVRAEEQVVKDSIWEHDD